MICITRSELIPFFACMTNQIVFDQVVAITIVNEGNTSVYYLKKKYSDKNSLSIKIAHCHMHILLNHMTYSVIASKETRHFFVAHSQQLATKDA